MWTLPSNASWWSTPITSSPSGSASESVFSNSLDIINDYYYIKSIYSTSPCPSSSLPSRCAWCSRKLADSPSLPYSGPSLPAAIFLFFFGILTLSLVSHLSRETDAWTCSGRWVLPKSDLCNSSWCFHVQLCCSPDLTICTWGTITNSLFVSWSSISHRILP